jgi:phosphoribosylformylglycinamidine cyclo-ligase
LPEGVGARLERARWPVPEIFEKLASWGDVAADEMFDAFNMGLGMLVVVGRGEEGRALQALGEGVVVGECVSGGGVTIT